jgi:hypothetical protein
MTVRFQLTIDCSDAQRQVRFWASALGYVIEPPPAGFDRWNDYWRSIGVPENELDDAVDAADSLVDPDGHAPRIWFQQVPEAKSVKNRLHLDIDAGGGRTVALEERKRRVVAECERVTAEGATALYVHEQHGLDHYAFTMQDPEGNEFCVH